MSTRLALVEQWQATHEEACATRWGLLLKLIGWGGSLAVALVLSVAGFGLKSLYDGQQKQLDGLRALSLQVAQVPASAPAAVVSVNPAPVPSAAPTAPR
jgi:hypothetical protein